MTRSLSLLTLALVLLSPAAMASRTDSATTCLNQCQNYRIFCRSEVMRQVEEMAASKDRHCLTPDSVNLSLAACAQESLACESSCFGKPPANPAAAKQ